MEKVETAVLSTTNKKRTQLKRKGDAMREGGGKDSAVDEGEGDKEQELAALEEKMDVDEEEEEYQQSEKDVEKLPTASESSVRMEIDEKKEEMKAKDEEK